MSVYYCPMLLNHQYVCPCNTVPCCSTTNVYEGVLLRTPGREPGDLLRIMAVEDSTFVSLGNGTNYTLNSVEFVELELDNETYLYIEADKVWCHLQNLISSSEGMVPPSEFDFLLRRYGTTFRI